jgi:heme A synthase
VTNITFQNDRLIQRIARGQLVKVDKGSFKAKILCVVDTIKGDIEMGIVQMIHSINRWIIVVVAVIALVKFLVGWLRSSSYEPIDKRLMTAYTVLLDVQLVLGIILLIGLPIVDYRIEHAVTMVLAIILAHLSRVWRDKPDKVKFRNNFFAILVGMLLIIAGVFVLPQGW